MSDLLRLALKAQIPVVTVTTDDIDNLEDLLKELGDGRSVEELGRMTVQPNRWKPKHIYYGVGDVPPKEVDYNDLLEKEITLVVVNAEEGEWRGARNCGSLTPPIDYIKDALSGFLTKQQVERLSRYFVGMSMKDVIEVIMLTQARDNGKLTPTGINETKSYLGAGLEGLEAIDTNQQDYVPPGWAEEWLEVEAPLLQLDQYRELWPKGFMLYGPTGTGKTELARFIGKRLGWPLYRLDLGSLYSRWQGQSEENLRRVLSFVSAQGECVFLLDEAEKLFGQKAEGQASLSTLLSMLLWWLQGESNRTVTVMTANKLDVIPPELYRPGRLDAVHEMSGLTSEDELAGFRDAIAQRLGGSFDIDPDAISATVEWQNQPISQATVVAQLRSAVKRILVKENEND